MQDCSLTIARVLHNVDTAHRGRLTSMSLLMPNSTAKYTTLMPQLCAEVLQLRTVPLLVDVPCFQVFLGDNASAIILRLCCDSEERCRTEGYPPGKISLILTPFSGSLHAKMQVWLWYDYANCGRRRIGGHPSLKLCLVSQASAY